MAVNENTMLDYTEGMKKTRQQVIEKLHTNGKLTDEEIELLETQDVIIIGDIEIDFSKLGLVEGTRIGDIYTEDMIGTVIKNDTLDANLPSDIEWIILGKDENETIMLTTSKPIEDGFTVYMTAQAWLSYEDDLNEVCAGYGGIIQGQEIKSRSITLDDVNRVTGFVEPSFNTYTFTNEETNDYENKRVNYWHPDTEGTATSEDGNGNPNYWSKNETTYECDEYYYYIESDDTVKYAYEGTNLKYVNYIETTLKNTNIIFGENLDYTYYLASTAVSVMESFVWFSCGNVNLGCVNSFSFERWYVWFEF